MIDGRNFFDPPIKNDKLIFDNIQKIATGQGDDYITGCLLNYIYFKEIYKLIAIDLKIHKSFFIIEKVEETDLKLSNRTVKVLWFFCFN